MTTYKKLTKKIARCLRCFDLKKGHFFAVSAHWRFCARVARARVPYRSKLRNRKNIKNEKRARQVISAKHLRHVAGKCKNAKTKNANHLKK